MTVHQHTREGNSLKPWKCAPSKRTVVTKVKGETFSRKKVITSCRTYLYWYFKIWSQFNQDSLINLTIINFTDLKKHFKNLKESIYKLRNSSLCWRSIFACQHWCEKLFFSRFFHILFWYNQLFLSFYRFEKAFHSLYWCFKIGPRFNKSFSRFTDLKKHFKSRKERLPWPGLYKWVPTCAWDQ